MAIFVIENVGAIETGLLPSGDMKAWHHPNEKLRAIVEGACRGRGYLFPPTNFREGSDSDLHLESLASHYQ